MNCFWDGHAWTLVKTIRIKIPGKFVPVYFDGVQKIFKCEVCGKRISRKHYSDPMY